MATAAQLLLDAQGVSYRYGTKTVLTNFSLQVNKGDIIGIVGANGAGKTTALRVLAGILPPQDGTVVVCGRLLSGAKVAEGQKNLGYLPENPGVYPDITTAEYLTFLARTHNLPQQSVDDIAAKTGCDAVMNQPLETLSKGWRQRVYLAGVLMHQPKVLILDEPTDGLDPLQKAAMYRLIQEVSRTAGVILSTHALEEAEHLCNRLVILSSGQILAENTINALKNKYKTLHAAFYRIAEKEGVSQ